MFVEYCLKWKLRKGQAVAAGQVVVVAALVSFPKWKELVMNVVCLLLAMYSNQSLVERLEAVGVAGGATGGAVLAGMGAALVVDGPSG